jgi:hypothetical protein
MHSNRVSQGTGFTALQVTYTSDLTKHRGCHSGPDVLAVMESCNWISMFSSICAAEGELAAGTPADGHILPSTEGTKQVVMQR